MGQLEFNYIWIYAWILNNFNCQYDIHYMTKLHKHGGWRTWNSCGCGIVVFVVVICYFCPYKCTSPITCPQVVCPNIFKCQMVLSGSFSPADPTINQHVVRWGSKSKHHKDTCLQTIGPNLQILRNHSTLNTMGRRPYVSGQRNPQTCTSNNHN